MSESESASDTGSDTDSCPKSCPSPPIFAIGVDIEINNFRFSFSNGDEIRMLTLMQPILKSEKFRGIPKLVVSQFCRGRFMNDVAVMDDIEALSKEVNGQESVIKAQKAVLFGDKSSFSSSKTHNWL